MAPPHNCTRRIPTEPKRFRELEFHGDFYRPSYGQPDGVSSTVSRSTWISKMPAPQAPIVSPVSAASSTAEQESAVRDLAVELLQLGIEAGVQQASVSKIQGYVRKEEEQCKKYRDQNMTPLAQNAQEKAHRAKAELQKKQALFEKSQQAATDKIVDIVRHLQNTVKSSLHEDRESARSDSRRLESRLEKAEALVGSRATVDDVGQISSALEHFKSTTSQNFASIVDQTIEQQTSLELRVETIESSHKSLSNHNSATELRAWTQQEIDRIREETRVQKDTFTETAIEVKALTEWTIDFPQKVDEHVDRLRTDLGTSNETLRQEIASSISERKDSGQISQEQLQTIKTELLEHVENNMLRPISQSVERLGAQATDLNQSLCEQQYGLTEVRETLHILAAHVSGVLGLINNLTTEKVVDLLVYFLNHKFSLESLKSQGPQLEAHHTQLQDLQAQSAKTAATIASLSGDFEKLQQESKETQCGLKQTQNQGMVHLRADVEDIRNATSQVESRSDEHQKELEVLRLGVDALQDIKSNLADDRRRLADVEKQRDAQAEAVKVAAEMSELRTECQRLYENQRDSQNAQISARDEQLKQSQARISALEQEMKVRRDECQAVINNFKSMNDENRVLRAEVKDLREEQQRRAHIVQKSHREKVQRDGRLSNVDEISLPKDDTIKMQSDMRHRVDSSALLSQPTINGNSSKRKLSPEIIELEEDTPSPGRSFNDNSGTFAKPETPRGRGRPKKHKISSGDNLARNNASKSRSGSITSASSALHKFKNGVPLRHGHE